MAPTSEERREVAEDLRHLTIGHYVQYKEQFFDELAEVVVGFEDYHDFDVVLEKLADLIDPTCRNTLPQNWGTFECSECGAQFEVSSVFMTESGNDDSEPIIPNYCPECGARVVTDDE